MPCSALRSKRSLIRCTSTSILHISLSYKISRLFSSRRSFVHTCLGSTRRVLSHYGGIAILAQGTWSKPTQRAGARAYAKTWEARKLPAWARASRNEAETKYRESVSLHLASSPYSNTIHDNLPLTTYSSIPLHTFVLISYTLHMLECAKIFESFSSREKKLRKGRVDRGELSHILFQSFCILCIQYLGRLWYANVLSEPLATIEQYRISCNRNTIIVNDHFITEGHLWPVLEIFIIYFKKH